MKTKIAFIAIFTFALFDISFVYAQTTDTCIGVLREKVMDEFGLKESKSFASDVKNALCKSTDNWKTKKAGGGIKIPIAEFIVGGQFTKDQREKLADQLCSDDSETISEANAKQIVIRLGAANVNETYLKCRKTAAGHLGLSGTYSATQNGELISLNLKWNDPTPGQAKNPKILKPWATILGPIQCAELPVGTTIFPLEKTVSCKRTSLKEAASVVIHTDWGDLPFLFEAEAKNTPPAKPKCRPVLTSNDHLDCYKNAALESKKSKAICMATAKISAPSNSGLQTTTFQQAILRSCMHIATINEDLLSAKAAFDKYQPGCTKMGAGSSECQAFSESSIRLNRMLDQVNSLSVGVPTQK